MNQQLWQIYVESNLPTGLEIAPYSAKVYTDKEQALDIALELNQLAKEEAESLPDEPVVIDTFYVQEVILWQHFQEAS